ncbi:11636_t:CDS:2, partial [Diversispora eburnea]
KYFMNLKTVVASHNIPTPIRSTYSFLYIGQIEFPTPMDVSTGVSSYFNSTENENWSFMDCLEYLSKQCVHLTSENRDEIFENCKIHLRSIISSKSTLKRAKDKASKMENSAQRTFHREEVCLFFEKLDTEAKMNATKNLKNAMKIFVNEKESLYETKLEARTYSKFTRHIEDTDAEVGRSYKRSRQSEDYHEETGEATTDEDVNASESLLQKNDKKEDIQDDVQYPNDTITESLVPKNVHDFLVHLFSKNLTAKEWHCEIDDLRSPEKNDPVMNAVVRVIRRTLPQFIKAFSLEDQNPLINITTIEGAHLNSFVHPCLDAFLWYIANIHYEYGEITSKKHVNNNRADGAGFMTDVNKYQLVYVEGSRPVTKEDKEITDIEKITKNIKNIFAKIVKETIKNRRRLPETLYVFGGQSFRLRIHLFYIDYCGTYRLNEVDNTNLPRKFSEMKDFIYFYECVLKWALLVRNVTESFDKAKTEQRPSRLSYANALLQLND